MKVDKNHEKAFLKIKRLITFEHISLINNWNIFDKIGVDYSSGVIC